MNQGSGRFLWWGVGALFLVFLLVPLALVIVFAFTSKAITNFPIEALSLRWWTAMVDHPQFLPSLRRSLTIGGIVAVTSAVVGTMASIGLAAMPPRIASAILSIVSLPLMLPPLVLAVALATFYVGAGVRLGLATVTMSHVLLTQPFVILIVFSQMRDFDRRIIESARDLGASAFTAFRTVTLPIIAPTVFGAALMAAALSFDDFVVTFFTIGGGNTLPTLVWGMMRSSVTPVVNAIGTLLLAATVAFTLIGLALTRYRG